MGKAASAGVLDGQSQNAADVKRGGKVDPAGGSGKDAYIARAGDSVEHLAKIQ